MDAYAGKAFSESAERNRGPIADVLARYLPPRGLALEIASGTGQHALHFAQRFPAIVWQPTDADPAAVMSIRAWRAENPLPNLREPRPFDAAEDFWPPIPNEKLDAVLAINLIHISPWEATLGLLRGAKVSLKDTGFLYLYGPYFRDDQETAPSNRTFDERLRSINSAWGVRRLEEVVRSAEENDLLLVETVEMPANNTSVIFRPR